jgi:hypothetical protein
MQSKHIGLLYVIWTVKWLAYKIHMQQKTKYCQDKQMQNKERKNIQTPYLEA